MRAEIRSILSCRCLPDAPYQDRLVEQSLAHELTRIPGGGS